MIAQVTIVDGIMRPADDRNIGKKPSGPSDLDVVLPMLLPRLQQRRTCIQAGACLGLWPLKMAEYFERVITFEPEPTNFHCAAFNCKDVYNIELHEASLGSDPCVRVGMRLDKKEKGNPGAHYAVAGLSDIATVTIDSLGLDDVDLIYLDIEGYEATALQGALKTIQRCKPIIGIEDKRLNVSREQANAKKFVLEELNYKSVGRPNSMDEIFIP